MFINLEKNLKTKYYKFLSSYNNIKRKVFDTKTISKIAKNKDYLLISYFICYNQSFFCLTKKKCQNTAYPRIAHQYN